LVGALSSALIGLAANFDEIEPEPLTGDLTGFYKLRVGDYRVLYQVLHGDRLIVVHVIGHRREIYRKR
jgi:mRNA interferase RelE/StbE